MPSLAPTTSPTAPNSLSALAASRRGRSFAKSADADARATLIAQQILAWQLPERDGRWELAVIVESDLRVVERSVSSYLGSVPGQHPMFEQLCCDLERVFRARIVGDPPRVPPRLDLVRLANGGSLSAWAWSFARTAVRMLKANGSKTAHESPTADLEALGVAVTGLPEDLEAELDGVTEELCEDLSDEISGMLRYARGRVRTHLQAIMARSVYGLPPLRRNVDHPRREELLAALEQYPGAVRKAMLGDDPDGYAELFSGWSPSDRDRLVEIPAEVSASLVTAALTPISPPSEKVRSRLRAIIDGQVKDRGRAERLWKALIEVMSESDCSDLHPTRVPGLRPAEERLAARRAWEEAVDALTPRERSRVGDIDTAIDELWVRCHLNTRSQATVAEQVSAA